MMFLCKVVDGEMKWSRKTALQEHLKTLEDKICEVHIDELEDGANVDQHGYYRATNRWIINNCESFGGWDEDDLHDLALEKVATYKKMVQSTNGRLTEVTKKEKTSDMSKKRMARFITEWHAWLVLNEDIYPPSNIDHKLKHYKTTKATNSKL